MRLGIGYPTVLDALSSAKVGDKSLRPVLEGAYNRTSDLGLIARTLWDSGEAGLEALKVKAGHPIRPQLAERLPNPEAVIKKLGTVGVQPKYDGFRVQIHKAAGQVSIFSRNLESMTEMFPELVAAAAALNVESVILDGEAIAYNPESEEYRSLPGDDHAPPEGRHRGVRGPGTPACVRLRRDVPRRDGPDATALRAPVRDRFRTADRVGHLGDGAADRERTPPRS